MMRPNRRSSFANFLVATVAVVPFQVLLAATAAPFAFAQAPLAVDSGPPGRDSQLPVASQLTENQASLSPDEIDLLRRLMEGLRSPKNLDREEATSQLNELPEKFLPSLEAELATSSSPEVIDRLSGIISHRKQEIRQRITREFIRSREIGEHHEFQGWKSFSRAAGYKDRKTKALFLRLLDAFPELIYKEITTPQEAFDQATLVAAAVTTRLDISREVTVEDGIALAYLTALCEDRLDPGLEMTGHRVFSRHPFSTTLMRTSKTGTAMASLYAKFAKNAKNKQIVLLSCFNAEIPVARDISLELLQSDSADKEPENFELAMQGLAKFGTAEDIPVVEKWLGKSTVIRELQRVASPDAQDRSLVIIEIQAQDLALATSIVLHKENPYPFFPMFRQHPLRGFVSEMLGFQKGTPQSVRDDLVERFRKRLLEIPKTFQP